MEQQAEEDKRERITGLGRRTRDSKEELNDSPEIPDRGRQQTFPTSLRCASLEQQEHFSQLQDITDALPCHIHFLVYL